MTTLDVAWIALRRRVRGTAGWATGVAALGALYVLSYRSVSGAKSAAIDGYSPALRRALDLQDLTTAAGYLGATAFGIPLLVFTAVFAASTATRAVATDEESGALDLVLAGPVARRHVVVGRWLAGVVELAVIGVVLAGVVVALRPAAGLTIAVSSLSAEVLTWWLLGGCLLGLGFAVSAGVGRRAATIAGASALFAVAYLAGSFLPLLHHLAWTRRVSPFAWAAGEPLRSGLTPATTCCSRAPPCSASSGRAHCSPGATCTCNPRAGSDSPDVGAHLEP